MNEANYGKCRDLSVIWEFSKIHFWDLPAEYKIKGGDLFFRKE